MDGDAELMARALTLAGSARRRTAPNPWVGCVLVRDGVVVGEGATAPPGGPHAEIAAIRAAGPRAAGATAYVTLEPCAHHGRTPPCADALVDAAIARVVVATEDPDRRVAGRGIERLRAAGITVDTGVARTEAEEVLAPYRLHRADGRAFAVVKTAASLDGRVAARDGSSRWVTGAAARADAHELRADSQAILVGSGTALADRPSLTVRDADPATVPRAPLRVLVDARGRVGATGPLFDTELAPTLVVTTDAAPGAATRAWLDAGAKVVTVAPGAGGGVDLHATLELLAGHDVLQVLVDGGPTVVASFVTAGLADRVVAYVAPTLLGTDGTPAFALDGPATIEDAGRWHLVSARQLGDDVRLEYRPASGGTA